jgi:hypothetical protein
MAKNRWFGTWVLATLSLLGIRALGQEGDLPILRVFGCPFSGSKRTRPLLSTSSVFGPTPTCEKRRSISTFGGITDISILERHFRF